MTYFYIFHFAELMIWKEGFSQLHGIFLNYQVKYLNTIKLVLYCNTENITF